MTITITMAPRIRRGLLVLAGLLAFLLLTADSCGGGGAESATQSAVNAQQDIYNKNQPLHTYQLSNERAIIQQLYDARIQHNLNTWSVWVSNNGLPLGMCASKGFPIPYTTSMTNPTQAVQPPSGGSQSAASIGQAEPNGLYPGTSNATWVMCLDANGIAHPVYMEPMVMAYTYPVQIQDGKVVQVGNAGGDSAITLPSK